MNQLAWLLNQYSNQPMPGPSEGTFSPEDAAMMQEAGWFTPQRQGPVVENFDPNKANLSVLTGWSQQAAKDRNALDTLFQGAVMGGDLDKATRLANTPEQRALLDVAYAQRINDQDRRARIDAGKQYDAPTNLMGDYARAQEAKLARNRMEEDRRMKIQQFYGNQALQQANIAEKNADVLKTKAQTDKANKEAAILEKTGGIKLGQGQRMTPSGGVELIEGTPQYRKEADKHAKDYGALLALDTKTDNAIKKIDEILDKKNEGGFNSQFGGYNAYLTRMFPGQTQDVGAKIESLKANMKTAGLELIRAGGSIGQMTEREWPIVQDQLDRLDPKMSEEQARDAFKNIKNNFMKIKQNALDTYKTEWGDTQFAKKSGGGDNTVTLPDGRVATFPSKAAADAARKQLGM